MIYRILTEERDNLAAIASRFFTGFNIGKLQGYWEGTAEPSAVIEIDALGPDLRFETVDKVRALALLIKETNAQNAVLIQAIPAESKLV